MLPAISEVAMLMDMKKKSYFKSFLFSYLTVIKVCYALIDATMLDWEIARQLGLQGRPDTLNGRSSSEPTENVNLTVSAHAKNLQLPSQTIHKSQLVNLNPCLANMPIVDYISTKPKMMISIVHAFLTVPTEVITISSHGPFAIKC